jgi:alpha-L-rhamnosidase
MNGGRDDVLWNVLQEDTQPSYGFFLASTAANPDGLTTMPEFWDLHDSKNHMILLQIEEWFHGGLAGIRQAAGSAGYRQLVIDPRIVGDLGEVQGRYETPQGEVAVHWVRRDGAFRMELAVPPNTTAEVRIPTGGDAAHVTASAAALDHMEGDRAVYRVRAGSYVFTAHDPRAAR